MHKNLITGSLLVALSIGGLTFAVNAKAGSFDFGAAIEVVSTINATATRQLKFEVNVTPHRSITISAVSPQAQPGAEIKVAEEGHYKIDADKKHTVQIVANDAGNVEGVKLSEIKGQYGNNGKKKNLLDDAVSSLITPGETDKDLRVELAMLEIDPLNIPRGTRELTPEFNLDVGYE